MSKFNIDAVLRRIMREKRAEMSNEAKTNLQAWERAWPGWKAQGIDFSNNTVWGGFADKDGNWTGEEGWLRPIAPPPGQKHVY